MNRTSNLEKLLHAMDRYIEARKRLEAEATQACYDWDCGIANDLGDSFLTPDLKEQLVSAKRTLETELDDYVDSRIEIALRKRSGAQEAR